MNAEHYEAKGQHDSSEDLELNERPAISRDDLLDACIQRGITAQQIADGMGVTDELERTVIGITYSLRAHSALGWPEDLVEKFRQFCRQQGLI